tara:strand:+ start:1409 stop:1993 length:585 start_codon:yes stop_codon:yes gene_type:complete
MNYKRLIQIILIFFSLLLTVFFYYKYFNLSNFKKKTDQEISSGTDANKVLSGNVVTKLTYENYDIKGNKYIIESKIGKFNEENKEEIFMVKVTAFIELKNGKRINLRSQEAIYNTNNSNTNFFGNVELDYQEHIVNADNIDIIFDTNKLTAYNNLVYKNFDLNLIADKVEIDLISKDTKISMFDDKKVKILKKN